MKPDERAAAGSRAPAEARLESLVARVRALEAWSWLGRAAVAYLFYLSWDRIPGTVLLIGGLAAVMFAVFALVEWMRARAR